MRIAITADVLYTPSERIDQPVVMVEDGVIAEIASRRAQEVPAGAKVVDLGDAALAPGFIDTHIHGAGGHDVMEADADGLSKVERMLGLHGVTSYLPTTITAPVDKTLAALERLADAIEAAADGKQTDSALRARPVGIHLEGPFISHARRGVHPPACLLPPTLATFEKFWLAARGHIKVITIAPELEGAREVIAEATRRGVCVSLGHSDADLKTTQAGVAAGARRATHTFNAMRPLEHREPGILGEVLTDERLSAEIIVDGVHVDPVIVRLFLQAKGDAGAVLVTDGTAATGMPDGRYRLGGLEVEVKEGKCMADGRLAGSVLTMDRAVRNVMKFGNWDLQRTVRLATLNPASTIGMAGTIGKLAPGAAADMVALNAGGEIRKTIIRGRIA
jgi:N-acetylglucosamine-6-phosphate deacetylase